MRVVIVGTFLVAAIACGSDKSSVAPVPVSMAGTWSLQTINGATLPIVLATSPAKFELLSDVFVVAASGGFVETSITRTTGSSVTTDTSKDAGTYTISGNDVFLRWTSDGSTATVTVSGNTFTARAGSTNYIYTR